MISYYTLTITLPNGERQAWVISDPDVVLKRITDVTGTPKRTPLPDNGCWDTPTGHRVNLTSHTAETDPASINV